MGLTIMAIVRISQITSPWALALGLLAAGCAATAPLEAADAAPGGPIFDFSGKPLVPTSNILHGVKLYFQMDREPRKDKDGRPVEEPMLALLKGQIYAAGWADEKQKDAKEADLKKLFEKEKLFEKIEHRFSYEEGQFVVDGLRYRAQKNGALFFLKERDGDFVFTFRGRTVKIEHDGHWKPAVLLWNEEEREEVKGSPEKKKGRSQTSRTVVRTKVLNEQFVAAGHHFVASPGTDKIEIDGKGYLIRQGSTVTLDRQGAVRVSR